MDRKHITKEQFSIILSFIDKNYSVVREGLNGLMNIDIENFIQSIWTKLDDDDTLNEYLLFQESNYQVEDFERIFELNDWMVSNIKHQEKYFDPNYQFSKLNKYAKKG